MFSPGQRTRGFLGVAWGGCLYVAAFLAALYPLIQNAELEANVAEKQTAVLETREAANAEPCREDIRCWAEDALIEASVACADAVQSVAKWDYEWTDTWTEPKFSRYRWKDKGTGVITYTGDKLKLQNGFGAWKRADYSCDYDPASKTVVGSSAF